MPHPKPVPREAILIVNTHSRKGRKLFGRASAKLKEAGIRLIAANAVSDPAKLDETVATAVEDGAPMIIVGGGDGSLSATVDHLVDRDCVLALLPLGTANSFARTLGMPLDLDGAIRAIVTGRRRRIDLGVIDNDYFANSAAIGLSPMIADSVPRNLKRYLGRAGYLLWALWCLMRFRPFELIVENDVPHRLVALEVRIANGRFHGGVEVAEDADLQSGEILVQAVTGRARRTLVFNWLATLLRLPARHASITEFAGEKLRIVTRPPLDISIDGEVAARTPVIAEAAYKAIEVIVPAQEAR